MAFEDPVPCDECAARTLDLRSAGFQVLGCRPDPARPGICIIQYVRSQGTTAALAAPAAAAAAMPPPAATAATADQLTPTQRHAAQAIVNLFETSAVLGQYGKVTVLAGDTGHLSYGRSQTTLGSGNLAKLVARYVGAPGARFGRRLGRYLQRLQERDFALDVEPALHNALRAAADDPLMREIQDQFFDEEYWAPAVRTARRLGVGTPLGVAVVYDSKVHGSWDTLAARTNAAAGALSSIGERAWVRAYVAERRHWLATHPRRDLRGTVYRMETFERLIAQDRWGLELPFVVRDAEISALTLTGMPPGSYDGPAPGTRPLAVATPLLRGLDVRLLQLHLSDEGVDIRADGIFGTTSADLVAAYQRQRGLPVTGLVDAQTVAVAAAAALQG